MKRSPALVYTILLLIVTCSGITQSQDMFDPRFLTYQYPGQYPYQYGNDVVQDQTYFQHHFQNQVQTSFDGLNRDGQSDKKQTEFDEKIRGVLDMLDIAFNILSTNPAENILAFIDLYDIVSKLKED